MISDYYIGAFSYFLNPNVLPLCNWRQIQLCHNYDIHVKRTKEIHKKETIPLSHPHLREVWWALEICYVLADSIVLKQ